MTDVDLNISIDKESKTPEVKERTKEDKPTKEPKKETVVQKPKETVVESHFRMEDFLQHELG